MASSALPSFAAAQSPSYLLDNAGGQVSRSLPSSRLCLLLAVFCYGAIFHVHARKIIPTYRKDDARLILGAHIVSGLYEILNWYARTALSGPPTATSFDMIACLIQCGTSIILVTPLRRGHPRFVRPTYQASAILRPILTFVAWRTGSVVLNEASVKIVNSFLYARGLIWLLSRCRLLKTYPDMYTVAIFGSALLGCADGPLPHLTTKAYVVTIALIGCLNEWTTNNLKKEVRNTHSAARRHLLDCLVQLGFADLETIKEMRDIRVLAKPTPAEKFDDYCPLSPVEGNAGGMASLSALVMAASSLPHTEAAAGVQRTVAGTGPELTKITQCLSGLAVRNHLRQSRPSIHLCTVTEGEALHFPRVEHLVS